MKKLTKTTVDAEPAGDKERFIWDTELKGFGLRIFPAKGDTPATKVFIFQYRNAEGRTRRLNIGRYSDALTTDQARKLAKDAALGVHSGVDPSVVKKSRRAALTVNELLDLYVESERFKGNADTTRAVDLGRINRHLRPLIGREIADMLTTNDVLKAHRAITEGKTAVREKTKARGLAKVKGGAATADKSILLLSVSFNWAIENNHATANPAKMKIAPSGTRNTIIESADDYGRLFAALARMENEKRIRSAAADVIRFIALTGARRGEATGLRWAWVDLKAGKVTLPPKAHKAGHHTGKPRIITLPSEAQIIIARQPAGEPDDYVFKPAKGDGPMSLTSTWPAVRTEADLPPALGLHGLRHSIGTHLAVAGASPVELMEQLGHRQISTTLRYIHFADQARSTLAERAAAVAMAGFNGQTEKAEVTSIRKAG